MYFLNFHIFNINYLLPKIQYSFIPTYITFMKELMPIPIILVKYTEGVIGINQ